MGIVECKDLIKGLLTVDVKKRYNLESVKRHPWLADLKDIENKPWSAEEEEEAMKPKDEEDLDADIIQQLVLNGFDRNELIQSVLNRSFDSNAGVYFLLLHQKMKDRKFQPKAAKRKSSKHPRFMDVTAEITGDGAVNGTIKEETASSHEVDIVSKKAANQSTSGDKQVIISPVTKAELSSSPPTRTGTPVLEGPSRTASPAPGADSQPKPPPGAAQAARGRRRAATVTTGAPPTDIVEQIRSRTADVSIKDKKPDATAAVQAQATFPDKKDPKTQSMEAANRPVPGKINEKTVETIGQALKKPPPAAAAPQQPVVSRKESHTSTSILQHPAIARITNAFMGSGSKDAKSAQPQQQSSDAPANGSADEPKRRQRSQTVSAGIPTPFAAAQNPQVSEAPKTPAPIDSRNSSSGNLSDSSEVRTVRFAFSVSTTSALPGEVYMDKIIDILNGNSIDFKREGFLCHCIENPNMDKEVKFELEVCKIPRLQLHGVRFKRTRGDIWEYKRVCQKLMKAMEGLK